LDGIDIPGACTSDDDKRVALKRHAAARAFDLRDEIVEYLLRRLKRDLPSLMTVLDALDRYSLETKRPITLHCCANCCNRRVTAMEIRRPESDR